MTVPQKTATLTLKQYIDRLNTHNYPTEELRRIFDDTPIAEVRIACIEGMRAEIEESDVVWAEDRVRDFYHCHQEYYLAKKIMERYLHRATYDSGGKFFNRALNFMANAGSVSNNFLLPALKAISNAIFLSEKTTWFRFQLEPDALEKILRKGLAGVMDRSIHSRGGYEEEDWHIAEWALKIVSKLKPDFTLDLVVTLIEQHESGQSVPANKYWFHCEKNLAVLQAVHRTLEAREMKVTKRA